MRAGTKRKSESESESESENEAALALIRCSTEKFLIGQTELKPLVSLSYFLGDVTDRKQSKKLHIEKKLAVPEPKSNYQPVNKPSISKYYQDKNNKTDLTLQSLQQAAKRYECSSASRLAKDLGIGLNELKKIFSAITHLAQTHYIDFSCTFKILRTLSTTALQFAVGTLYKKPIPKIQRSLNEISLSEIHQALRGANAESSNYTSSYYISSYYTSSHIARAATKLNLAEETFQTYIGALALNINREPHDIVNMTLAELTAALPAASPLNMVGAYVTSAPPLTKESIIAAFQKNYPSLRQVANYGLGCGQNILKSYLTRDTETRAALKALLPTLNNKALEDSIHALLASLPAHLRNGIEPGDKMASLPTARAPAPDNTMQIPPIPSHLEKNPYTPSVVQ